MREEKMNMNIEKALKDILIGKKMGNGCFRDVYLCKIDYSLVVKIEKENGEFHNIREWLVWKELEYSELKKWFAPCIYISNDGKVLIQKKIEFGRKKDYPDKVPSFFTDIQTHNFGFIGKQLVCCDYGSTIITKNFNDKKLKKADWKIGLTRV
jgi:hypothetical protein